MTNGPAIVIEGTRKDWPGGPRTLTPLEPSSEANQQITWYGAELAPDHKEVWFKITLEATREMSKKEPPARGDLLIECLIAWTIKSPDRQLELRTNFLVIVDRWGTRIEPILSP